MKNALLSGRVSRYQRPLPIEPGQLGQIKRPQGNVYRRHQPSVFQPRTDITGRTECQSSGKQARAQRADGFPQRTLIHEWISKRGLKKSRRPKLPDFRARAITGVLSEASFLAKMLLEARGDFEQAQRGALAVRVADRVQKPPVFLYLRAQVDGLRVPATDDNPRGEE